MRKFLFAALGVPALVLTSGAGTAAAESSTADLAATDAVERMVTLWTEPNDEGRSLRIDGEVRPSGRVCTERTDDIDFRVDFDGALAFMNRNAESVNDNAGAHCDWQLIGPNGGRSTWVEGDIDDLQNLGSGWRNRAVAIRFT
jgi:hypothetical protein